VIHSDEGTLFRPFVKGCAAGQRLTDSPQLKTPEGSTPFSISKQKPCTLKAVSGQWQELPPCPQGTDSPGQPQLWAPSFMLGWPKPCSWPSGCLGPLLPSSFLSSPFTDARPAPQAPQASCFLFLYFSVVSW
jgi:hypothetical protein